MSTIYICAGGCGGISPKPGVIAARRIAHVRGIVSFGPKENVGFLAIGLDA
jgi:hypothetical protein